MEDNKKDKDNKISYIFTRETMGMTTLLFCVLVFIMLLTYDKVFAGIGSAVCTFMYGTFGYASYLVIFALAYLGERLVFGKKIKITRMQVLVTALTALMLFLLFHAVTTRAYAMDSYGKYISDCYFNAANGYAGYTFGGVISALIVFPVAKGMTFIGAYVVFAVLSVACLYLTYLVFRRSRPVKALAVEAQPVVEEPVSEPQPQIREQSQVTQVQPVYVESKPVNVYESQASQREYKTESDDKFSPKNLGRKILFENGEFAAESYRRNMIFNENSYFNKPSAALASEEDYLSSFSDGSKKRVPPPEKSYAESYREEILSQPVQPAPANYVYGEKPVTNLNGFEEETNYENAETYDVPAADYSQPEPYEEAEEQPDYYERENSDNVAPEREDTPVAPPVPPEEPFSPQVRRSAGFNDRASEDSNDEPLPFNQPATEEVKEDKSDEIYKLFGGASTPSARSERGREASFGNVRSNAELFDDEEEKELSDEDIFGRRITREEPQSTEERAVEPRRVTRLEKPDEAEKAVDKPVEKVKHVWKKYVRPSLDLLDDYPENSNVNTAEIEDNKRIIVEALARYRIASEVSNVTIGPAITRYDIIIEDKTKTKMALGYRDAIAMELRKENVNAYLNYSKGAISIEVPNSRRSLVGLKGMLASSNFINCKPSSLTFALGKNVDGEVVCPDITKMPHLLVAGTTGSGKSICLSALLVSLLYKYGPEDLRLILVDPKQVEFISFDKLPHLMINEIIYDVNKAIKALNWAIKEMERRYTLFKDMTEAGRATKNLDEYNAHLPEGEEKLPKILIVLDEFGDLMLQAKKDIESRIIKLVQKARACGIHLILATQRPSVDCITGLIKSNLPTRIGFKVNSFDDARTIFDIGGAEKLLGRGDMYFRSAENPDLARIQGCFVDTHEVQKVTDFVKANNETYFDQDVSDFINTVEQEETASSAGGGSDGEDAVETKIDDTFIKALKYCVTANQASVSMIQRRFPVGYIKACKIIDWMTNMNYITQSEGSKPRKVLLSKEEFFNTYGDIDD